MYYDLFPAVRAVRHASSVYTAKAVQVGTLVVYIFWNFWHQTDDGLIRSQKKPLG